MRGDGGTGHTDGVVSLLFNPRLLMMASASASLAFWIPSVDDAGRVL